MYDQHPSPPSPYPAASSLPTRKTQTCLNPTLIPFRTPPLDAYPLLRGRLGLFSLPILVVPILLISCPRFPGLKYSGGEVLLCSLDDRVRFFLMPFLLLPTYPGPFRSHPRIAASAAFLPHTHTHRPHYIPSFQVPPLHIHLYDTHPDDPSVTDTSLSSSPFPSPVLFSIVFEIAISAAGAVPHIRVPVIDKSQSDLLRHPLERDETHVDKGQITIPANCCDLTTVDEAKYNTREQLGNHIVAKSLNEFRTHTKNEKTNVNGEVSQ
ncbi:hypothetical protein NMY22_g3444 [Coprinellus aureogranulatus]|nr:hypothetical protein NMY22_g3444 [Coprinellus aureogranulatus]